MDGLLRNKYALELGKLLDDHHGGEVVVLDMRALNFWTDFFIISTVTSSTHLLGLERHIKEFVRNNDLEILHRSRKPPKEAGLDSDEWCLLDLGDIVIHLMTVKARQFFELERLWGAAPLIYQARDHQTIEV
ncbi:MAG: ribosome silencing factor [Treponema sp.]|jgi:ribosome-associated protein|nr:ribosome silencing factor [Treponema sp.]